MMTTGTASQSKAGESSAAPVRSGELVADKYVVERTLGVGGMGVVVAARDRVLDRVVAIKFLLPKLAGSDTAVQRFVREARAATRVTSEHVVRLLEIDRLPSGTPFFVMEYLEGSDLRALLRERGPLAASLAVDYVLQALQAVAEGHLKGVVHRDIKPGNLFLTTRADGTPLIKVLDFGIAKTLESDPLESTALTSSDDVRLGSPAYMPPEQLQNPRDVDTRSDIWSLGATLYELLCGRPAFEATGYLELATRILSSQPAPMSEQQLPSALPKGLEQVLRKCLEKDRNLRYANAAELAAALAPFGSEDARVSLTRVTGMSSQHTAPLPRHVMHDSGSVATTLTVASEPDSSARAHADRRDTSRIGPVTVRRGRSWIILSGAVAAVLVIVGLSRRAPAPAPAEPVAANPAAHRVVAPAPPVLEALPAPSGQSPAMQGKPAAGETVRRRGVGHGSGKPAAPVVVPAASATPPAALSGARDAPSEPGLGRSAEIERLIEQRR
jgi:eukaryotic-like serine/threonine-protein kinase